MGRNPVQFQKGLSMTEFLQRYGSEEQCHAALVAMRWPDGFVCPRCGGREHSYYAARHLFQCSACRTQTSVLAGTIFHKSRTPLTKWFCVVAGVSVARHVRVRRAPAVGENFQPGGIVIVGVGEAHAAASFRRDQHQFLVRRTPTPCATSTPPTAAIAARPSHPSTRAKCVRPTTTSNSC